MQTTTQAPDHNLSAHLLREHFEAIDSDHDGRVSFDELRAWCQ